MILATPFPRLEGPNVVLRAPEDTDIAARYAIGRHEAVARGYGQSFDPAQPYTREHAERMITWLRNEPHAWVIDAGGFIGHLRFHSIDRNDRRAALAIGIEDPAKHGRGFGTEAVRLALGYGFETGLHRVSLRVLATNARAIASYRKCGFVEEGRERESALVEGDWQDDITMGVLARDFKPVASA